MPNTRCELLSPGSETAPFLTMTFPAYWSYLLDPSAKDVIFPVACWNAGPCGLALANLNPNPVTARLLSLFVAPPSRNQGVGKKLIQSLEELLRQKGVTEISASYTPNQPGIPALEAVLRAQNWSPPAPYLLLVRAGTDCLPALRTSPPFRRREFPPGYSLERWVSAAPEEQDLVRQWLQQGVTPPYLNPFVEPELLDPQLSLILRENNRLIGWLITHRLSEQLLRYTSLFVHPDIRIKGLGLCLTLEVLHRHIDSLGSDPSGEILCATYTGTPLADFWQRRWLAALPQARATLSVVSGKYLDTPVGSPPWAGRPALFESTPA